MNYPPNWPRCACGRPVLDGHLTCGRAACNEAHARDMANNVVTGGQFYGRDAGGELHPLGPTVDGIPDVWICRRVADYPGRRVPAGGAVADCTRCAAPLVFNPKREITAPKVCMQCARIVPLPFES